jgi:hypothetical protein
MSTDKNISSARKGMNRDNHPSELTKDEYSFALNSNTEDSNGNGARLHQNEGSNVQCLSVKEGYKVIGFKYHQLRNRTYLFITNPTTGCSEIGYIAEIGDYQTEEDIETKCNCNITSILSTPLEDLDLLPYCTYTTLVSDFCELTGECTACLDFSIDRPIKESNIQISDEKIGSYLFWTDGNTPRYLQLDNLEIYTQEVEPCTGEVTETCFDCEKLKVFQDFSKACLRAEVIKNGGNLRAGLIEVLMSYSTFDGTEISDYQSITNQIAIFDDGNNILDQTNLDYTTNQAVDIQVSNLDENYQFFNIAVIYRSGLDSAVTYFKYGTYPIGTTAITISSLKDKEALDFATLTSRRPQYIKAGGMAQSNNYIFQYNLESHRQVNLQPVANLLGAFGRWMTYQAKEDLYKDGVIISNYKSYLRDEQYPFSIRFYIGNFETAVFPLIPRPPSAEEKESFTTGFAANTNTNSVNAYVGPCEKQDRTERWQYENTATEIGECLVPAGEGEEVVETIEEESSCVVSNQNGTPRVLDTIASSTIDLDTNLDLVTYINQNAASIIASTGPNGADIRDVLEDPTDYNFNCVPYFPSSCTAPVLDSENMFAISVETQTTSKIFDPIASYTNLNAPTTCSANERDSSGNLTLDTTFVTNFMEPLELVYKKNIVTSNITCATAQSILNISAPSLPNIHFNYSGDLVLANLYTTKATTTIGAGFQPFIHKDALWFKVNFGTSERKVVQLSAVACDQVDDNTGTQLRMSFYDSCTAVTDLSTYSRIITNVATVGDPLKRVELLASDFPLGYALIAIDPPIRTRTLTSTVTVHTTTPPCGCFKIVEQDSEFISRITYTNLRFGKRQTYQSTCSYTKLILNDCDPVPHKYGLFGYYESEDTIPCNPELFDSSVLKISPADLPGSIQTDFESYYTTGLDGFGNYVLNSETDFQNKPIRFYKFPDSKVAPFFNESTLGPSERSTVYPIGFFLSNDAINAFLDIAVKNGLLTLQERLSITKYEIFRGDRSVNKSILAKGLLFDTYQYREKPAGDQVYYPNYPLNTLGLDALNGNINHPFGNNGNNVYTFHSPNTHFFKPSLTREMNIEGYQLGYGFSYFDEVRDHSTYTLLGKNAYIVATTLGIAEAAFELALQVANLNVTALSGGAQPGTATAIALAVTTSISAGVNFVFNIGKYRYQWLNTFTDLGKPNNFAYYSATIGYYNKFYKNDQLNSFYRGISAITYLSDGHIAVADENLGIEHKVNNVNREDSVFISLGATAYNLVYPTAYRTYDNYDVNTTNTSRTTWPEGTGRSERLLRRAASPYVSIKQWLPRQYGQLLNIDWVQTGYCGNLQQDNACTPAFGGDIFISRFSLKRKLPFFTSNAHKAGPLLPFKYSDYFNIQPWEKNNRFYIDYQLSDSTYSTSLFLFPDRKSEYNLDSTDPNYDQDFYIKPPSKFYLFSYGIPYFLVESEINCNFRYAKREKQENFYPNIKDVIEFTQESNVSIKEPNTYFYNFVYSANPSKQPYVTLPFNYSKEVYDKINNLKNAIIYSQQKNSDADLRPNWLNYRPLDFFQFPLNQGDLVDVSGIESEIVLTRFENGFTVFNAVDNLRDRLQPNNYNLGTGGIFANRSLNFSATDLGNAGTQNTAKVSCEFGHYWVDAKRGEVFELKPNAQGLENISGSLSKWFKRQLPFKILKFFPDYDIDNPYNGVGITMGWDNFYKRVFITKKDYIPNEGIDYINGDFYATTGYETIIASYVAQGYVFLGIQGTNLVFRKQQKQILIPLTKVEFPNPDYFQEASWTIAYSPRYKDWISYYSFLPNYYVNYPLYFQTGINNNTTVTKIGLWSHLPNLNSYQVFYGEKNPWIIEYPAISTLLSGQLESLNYYLDTRRYNQNGDAADIPNKGFNKAWVYNSHQNTGELNLVPQQKNNLRMSIDYPKHNSTSTDILQTEEFNIWSFNYLYNNIRRENSHTPVWVNDNVGIHTVMRNDLMDFRNTYKDRLRGDYFQIKLQQDIETRLKMVFKLGIDNRKRDK